MWQLIKSLVRKAMEEPFIASTGIAAFVHSTWALSVMFSGAPPEQVTTWRDAVDWALIVFPAALIAFSVDVGQIATSADIRNGNRALAKKITFAALAFTTYYLQWLYMAHHIPALSLGEGVRAEWALTVTWLRDASIWIVPGLLPLATLLYTVSHTVIDTGATETEHLTEHPANLRKALPEPEPVTELEPVMVLESAAGKARRPSRQIAGGQELTEQVARLMEKTTQPSPNGNGNGHHSRNGNGAK